jgi:hypothetical protein
MTPCLGFPRGLQRALARWPRNSSPCTTLTACCVLHVADDADTAVKSTHTTGAELTARYVSALGLQAGGRPSRDAEKFCRAARQSGLTTNAVGNRYALLMCAVS